MSNRLYALTSLAKRMVLLYRSLNLNQIEVENPTTGLRMIYIGEGESLNYVRKIFFVDAKETKTTHLPIWSLNQRIKQLTSSNTLIFVEINRVLKHLIPPGGLLTFPWIRQQVWLNSNDHLKRKPKIEATFGRKVRKFNYRFQITRDDELVQKFYEELYLPYITARFENTSHARALSEIRAAIKSGFLLQVFDHDIWISGAICRVKKKEICAFAFGHLPDTQYDLHWGALSATYYFIFKWADEHSVEKVDLLRSRPNTGDGVYEHKRRWGARPMIDSWPHTALWIFIPKTEIGPFLKTQLIWDRDEFIEIKSLSL